MILEACKTRGVKHVFISKLYYGQFEYKVTLSFPISILNKIPSSSYDTFRDATKFRRYASQKKSFDQAREKFIADICDNCPIDDFEYRHTKTSVSLYTNDSAGIVEFINTWNGYIIEVGSPKSPKISEYMADNPAVKVRDTYFHNKYKYCVVLHWRGNLEAINRFLTTGYEATKSHSKFNHVEVNTPEARYTTSNRLYFKSLEDVVLTRVALGECIERIEEIILSEDIENAGSITA